MFQVTLFMLSYLFIDDGTVDDWGVLGGDDAVSGDAVDGDGAVDRDGLVGCSVVGGDGIVAVGVVIAAIAVGVRNGVDLFELYLF